MCFLASGLFWGSLLVLWGVSLILNAMFNLNIPFFRVAFGLLIIWIGVSFLVGKRAGWCGKTHAGTAVAGERTPGDFNVVFGKGDIDLTSTKSGKVQVNVVFGHGILRVSEKAPVRVRGSAVFGNVEFPDGNSISFGDRSYETGSAKKGTGTLEIEANAVFGRLEIISE